MKIKKANDGALTNFEVLNFLQSRGASKEVAVTVTPSEYKVFEYLVETPASCQTRETITEFVEKAKKYDLAKAEIFNIIDTRPILPVLYVIVEKCDERFGNDGGEELLELVTTTLPAPPEEAEQPPEEEDGDAAAPEEAEQPPDEEDGDAAAAAETADGGAEEDNQ